LKERGRDFVTRGLAPLNSLDKKSPDLFLEINLAAYLA